MATADIAVKKSAQVERRNAPSLEEFRRDYLEPRVPVIITGALDQWKAIGKWNLDFFAKSYGNVPLSTKGQPYTLQGYFPVKDDNSPFTIAEFIEMVKVSKPEKPAPYLRNIHLEKFLPELLADVSPLPAYLSPNWLEGPFTQPLYSRLHGGQCELYIGGTGGKFPVLHWDTWHIHTFLAQIHGVKEYTLFAPQDSEYLYPNYNTTTVGDIENVDLQKFPLFAKATRINLELNAGEILFVPAGWWHTTRILTPSITLSMARVNQSNWGDFSRDLRKGAPLPLRPLVASYLTGLRVIKALT